MESISGMQDTKGAELPVLVVYSMWAVAYCVVSGVKIVGTQTGSYRRMGWRLDNADGRAKGLLDEWRSGAPIVNGRALLDAHNRLMDDVRHLT
jgi:hypothetical protein